jgi:hypothetical protein
MGTRRGRVVTALSYLLLALCLWLPYNPDAGLFVETEFTVASEAPGGEWTGFLSPEITMRPFTAFFYHCGYLLSVALGLKGSYIGYQIVYLLLVWLRAWLTYLAVSLFAGEASKLSYLCGAFTILHAADRLYLWIGQLNQIGFIVWSLAAVYLLMLGARAVRWRDTVLLVGMACAAQTASLASYEAQLPLLVIAPLLLRWLPGTRIGTRPVILAAWYTVIAVYLRWTAVAYLRGMVGYQVQSMSGDLSIKRLLENWMELTAMLIGFWKWSWNEGVASSSGIAITSVLAAAILLARLRHGEFKGEADWRFAGRAGATGLLLAVMSLPVFLLLADAGRHWRVLMLGGVGGAMVLASVAVGLGSCCGSLGKWLQPIWIVLVTAAGAGAAINQTAGFYNGWERHRVAVRGMLKAVPDLASGSVLILVNVPEENEPYGYGNYWFAQTVRLAYPGKTVAGVYVYQNGKTPADVQLSQKDGVWIWQERDPISMLASAPVSRSVIVEYRSQEAFTVGQEIPTLFQPSGEARNSYHPERVTGAQVGEVAERRYPEERSWRLYAVR